MHEELLILLSVVAISQSVIVTDIKEQNFSQVYYCPKDENCHYICHNTYAACLNVQFHCEGNSTCIIDCKDVLACSYAFMNCTDTATCQINCLGASACSFINLSPPCGPNANCTVYPPGYHKKSDFTSTVALMATKAFAINGHVIKNTYVVWDGTIQLLCFDIPKDPKEQQELFDNVVKTFYYVVVETNKTHWLNYPNFTFTLYDPLVIAAEVDTDALFTMTLRNDLNDYSSWIYPLDVYCNFTDETVTIYYEYFPNLLVTFDYISPKLNFELTYYVTHAMGYPNSSFIDITTVSYNSTLYIMTVYLPKYKCEPPAPFYGTYCWLDHWYSEGDVIVSIQDLFASPSGSIHNGDIKLDQSVSVMDTTFESKGVVVNSSSVFQVINASVSIKETLVVTKSYLEISGNGESNITANGVMLDQASLRINLTPEQEAQLIGRRQISIPAVNSGNINGKFDQLILINSNGSLADYKCLKSTQSVEASRLVILLELDESCNQEETPQFYATVIAVPLVVTISVVATIVAIIKRKRLKNHIRRLKSLYATNSEP